MSRPAIFSVLVGTLSVVIALALARATTSEIKNSLPRSLWERETVGLGLAERAWKLIPEAAGYSERKKLFVVSTSISMKLDFSEMDFQTFNFGFFAATPELLKLISRKIETQVRSSSKPSDVTILEFLPQAMTSASHQSLAPATHLRKALFLGWQDILSDLARSPINSVPVLSMKALGNSAPEINMNLLLHIINPNLREIKMPIDLRQRLQEDTQRQMNEYDLKNLRPYPRNLELFIESIKSLVATTRCLIVYSPPENKELWQRTLLGEKNRADFLQKIEAETGFSVHQLGETNSYIWSDFNDASHLRYPEGLKKFQSELNQLIQQKCPNQN